MRSFLEVDDLTVEELNKVIDLCLEPDLPKVLQGEGAALVFEKPSNRTRNSMEMAVHQLGGHPVYIRGEELGFDKRESVEDIVSTLSGYYKCVAARVFDHKIFCEVQKSRHDAVRLQVALDGLETMLKHPSQDSTRVWY